MAGQSSATLRGSEDIARGYGLGGEQLIDEQTGRDQKAAEQQYKAGLARSGFGGTFGAGQVAGIADQFSRGARQQKLGLRQATTDRVLGVRGQRAGLESQQAGREYQRSSEGTALQERNLGRNLGIQAGTQEQLLQSLSGPVANPFLGMNNQGGGANPMAGVLTNIGGAAAGYGGYLQGQQNQQQLLQQLRALFAGGSQGGGTVIP